MGQHVLQLLGPMTQISILASLQIPQQKNIINFVTVSYAEHLLIYILYVLVVRRTNDTQMFILVLLG